jgi:hypothetical protein
VRYLISLIFVLASSGTVFGQISFDAPRAYPVPSKVFALGDFTSDGLLDAVAGSSQTLYVLLGRGDGTLGRPLPIHTAATADAFTAIAVADFNRDSHADIALGSPGSLVILLGDGRLGFEVKATYVLTLGPHDLIAADFTGDNVLDIVSSDEGAPGNITFLKGNGDGTFQPPFRASTGGTTTRAADLDADGFVDLISADTPVVIFTFPGIYVGGNISVLRGDGAGNFQAGPSILSLVGELVIGDVNHDGKQDFVARQYGNFGGVTLVVFLGNGDGTFQEKVEARIRNLGASPMALGDLNGDGILDLVSPADFAWPVLLGHGDGTFSPPGAVAGGVPQAPEWGVTLADLNADGRLDVVGNGGTGGNGSNGAVRIAVSLGLGDGSFDGFLKTAHPETRPVTVTADFDRDGRPDLASVDGCVRLGTGNGFGPPACQPANALDVYPAVFAALVGDVNGDSIPDLVRNSMSPTGSLVIVVMAGNADGTLRPAQATTYARRAMLWILGAPAVLGDFNGDSRLDVAAFLSSTLLNNRFALAIFPGRGDGTFAAPALRFATTYYAEPVFLLTTDLNGDHNADLLVGGQVDSSGSSVLTTLIGNGDGTFVQKNTPLGVWRPRGAAIADINGDGLQDMALSMFASGVGAGTGILLGNGNGSFTFKSFQYAVFLSNTEVASMTAPILADLDGDHKTDMLMRADVGRRGYVMAWTGIGDGTFAAGVAFESTASANGANPPQVFLVDFDVDGKPDLVYNAVYLIRNTSQ